MDSLWILARWFVELSFLPVYFSAFILSQFAAIQLSIAEMYAVTQLRFITEVKLRIISVGITWKPRCWAIGKLRQRRKIWCSPRTLSCGTPRRGPGGLPPAKFTTCVNNTGTYEYRSGPVLNLACQLLSSCPRVKGCHEVDYAL